MTLRGDRRLLFLLGLTIIAAFLESRVAGAAEEKYTNRLINEKSPYLLQHAHNPVDWYPWGEEAFAKARKENKPIFLSVGYSTCHWCHVMEHESFENPEIAQMMNDNFVSIKVDREERPDVDQVYMTFVQATTGGGGWPMSVWLTPELKPFVGGTYFPPENQGGQPGFKSVLKQIAEAWKKDREKIVTSSDRLN
ncbi:MAG: thioredoxin domain-containing protein [Chthoniobacterales bacterium]|nr:thioredoxin domain-containing protein [Chthoniobacterales bacterium]